MKIQISPLFTNERTGWCHPHLVSCLLDMSQDSRVELLDYQPMIGYRTSQEARNEAADLFLKSECDWLLMLDNDTVPINPLTKRRVNYLDMAQAAETVSRGKGPEYPVVVGAPVPVLDDRLPVHVNAYHRYFDGYWPHSWGWVKMMESKLGSLVQVDAVGSGVMLLNRGALTASLKGGVYGHDGEALSYRAYPEDHESASYFTRPRKANGSTILGEDLHFCRRIEEVFGSVFVHVPSLSGHAHTVDLSRIPEIGFHGRGLERLGVVTPYPLDEFVMTLESLFKLQDELVWRREIVSSPFRIVEGGSGASTLAMVAAWRNTRPHPMVLIQSLEQNRVRAAWNNGKVQDEIRIQYQDSVSGAVKAKVHNAELLVGQRGAAYKIPDEVVQDPTLIHVLVIDGPGPYTYMPDRMALFDWAIQSGKLANGALIVVDDYEREAEQEYLKPLLGTRIMNKEVVGRTLFGSWSSTLKHE